MPWLEIAISAVVGILLGSLSVMFYYRRGLSAQQKQLQEDALKYEAENALLKESAQKDAEGRKRDLLLQAKEEITNARLELERDVRERKQELAKERNRLDQKEETIDRMLSNAENKQTQLEQKQHEIALLEEHTKELEAKKASELEKISGLSIADAKSLVLEAAEREYSHEMATLLKQMEEKTKQEADKTAKDIIVNSIQRYASDYVSEVTVSVVTLPNDEMKGRIIGREGRNIRAIETITGVDLIIDDTPEAVIISSFDPIRREIARLTIEKLVTDGRIHPARIEEIGRAHV